MVHLQQPEQHRNERWLLVVKICEVGRVDGGRETCETALHNASDPKLGAKGEGTGLFPQRTL